MSVSTSSAVPAPFSVSPSWSWDGNDGSWSTFDISVGTPGQSFRMLPSTYGSEIWVPSTDGCEGILTNIADCGALRGADDFKGQPSRGFDSSASSTWDLIGIYELATEQNLWGTTDNEGYYGFDTVSLESYPTGRSADLKSQTVAGVATENVWLGILGMGSTSAQFDVENGSNPSLLVSMKDQNFTPSISFGYTAGAAYASPSVPGSLVLGGYDKARFTPSDLSFPVGSDDNTSLPLSIESIIADNVFGGTVSLLPGGNAITTIIDSTVSQLWLPQYVCDAFAQAFGLHYDSYTGLYLVNDTIHRQLKQMNPSITFTLGSTDSSDATTNIILPYAAFDLQAGIPLYNYSTNYFPIRVAASETQQVLGRAFLQEAYVFVDWERNNFTIGQAIHQNKTTNIVPVLSPDLSSRERQSSGLGTGTTAGIAVAAVVVVLIAAGVAACLIVRSRRRRRRERTSSEEHLPVELQDRQHRYDRYDKPNEIASTPLHELHEGFVPYKQETDSKEVMELQADSLERELEGDGTRLGKYGTYDRKTRDVYEMP